MAERILLVFAAVLLVYSVYTEAMPSSTVDDIKTALLTCKERFTITPEQHKSFSETGILAGNKNEDAYCFIQCLMEEFGVVKDGVFLPEEKKKSTERVFSNMKRPDGTPVDVAQLKKNVDDCAAVATGETNCQKNYKIWECIQQIGAEDMALIREKVKA